VADISRLGLGPDKLAASPSALLAFLTTSAAAATAAAAAAAVTSFLRLRIEDSVGLSVGCRGIEVGQELVGGSIGGVGGSARFE
jgi:hypothetical protein